MNHKFKANASAPAKCITCSKDVVQHSEFATCEICKKFPCTVELVNEYAMCPDCLSKELEAVEEVRNRPQEIPEPIKRLEEERFNSQAAQIEKSTNGTSPLTDLPMGGDEFFNAETIATLELEKKIFSDDTVPQDKKWVFFAEQMIARRSHMQKALVESMALLREIRSRESSLNRSVNLLASKLRAEEKAKLKIQDINYVPVAPPKKVTTRTTKDDKVTEYIAKSLVMMKHEKPGTTWNDITEEKKKEYLIEARQIFVSNLSAINSTLKIERDLDNLDKTKE